MMVISFLLICDPFWGATFRSATFKSQPKIFVPTRWDGSFSRVTLYKATEGNSTSIGARKDALQRRLSSSGRADKPVESSPFLSSGPPMLPERSYSYSYSYSYSLWLFIKTQRVRVKIKKQILRRVNQSPWPIVGLESQSLRVVVRAAVIVSSCSVVVRLPCKVVVPLSCVLRAGEVSAFTASVQ